MVVTMWLQPCNLLTWINTIIHTRTKTSKKRTVMQGCCSLANKAQKQAACRDDAHWFTKQ